MKALAALLVFTGALTAAQTAADTLTAFAPVSVTAPGSTGTVSVNLAIPTGGVAPAAIELALSVPTSAVTSVAGSVGAAATAAGKQMSCGTLTAAAGGLSNLTCIIFGLNANVMAAGTVAQFGVIIATTFNSPSVPITLTNQSASDPSGESVQLTVAGASLLVQNACDFTGDGAISLQDVLAVVNKAIAGGQCGQQVCNAGDVEIEILVALGQIGCPAGGP